MLLMWGLLVLLGQVFNLLVSGWFIGNSTAILADNEWLACFDNVCYTKKHEVLSSRTYWQHHGHCEDNIERLGDV